MSKILYTYKEYQKKISLWQKKLGRSKKVKKLANKLYVEADKKNYSYLHSWNGEPLLQTPEDLLTIEDIVNKTKPEVIIELGVAWGGSLLYYDTLAKIYPIKKIIGVDIFIPKDLEKRINLKKTSKVHLIRGDTCSQETIKEIKKISKRLKSFLIHLDSDHTEKHVLNELNLYSPFLRKGNYLIVGDTIVSYIPKQKHRPRNWNKNNSPKTALDIFLKKNKNFKINKDISNKQLLTNNPGGYIYKI
jgi:cephalosporin hydroxylase